MIEPPFHWLGADAEAVWCAYVELQRLRNLPENDDE